MAAPAHSPSVFFFGQFELDAASSRLRKAGISLKLHPQPFQVLLLLLQHPGDLITREAIRTSLWGGNTFVDFERGINSCVNQIRVTLGDDSDKPRYIETIPRRGYRFIAPVSTCLPANRATALLADSSSLQPLAVGREFTSTASRKLPAFLVVAASVATLAASIAIYAWLSRSPSRELKEIQLTANSSDNPVTGDAISPDGKYLAYSDRQGVHIKLLATGESQTLSPTSSDWYFAWFPDNTRFLGSEISRPGLWSFSVIGGAPRRIRDDGTLGSVSPDGSLLAFTKNVGRLGDREMWLANSDGSTLRKILEVGVDAAVQEPWWSPDGKRLAYYIQRQVGDHLELTIETRELNGGAATLIYSENAATPAQTRARDFNWLPTGPILLSLAEPDSNLVNTLSVRCNLWELPMDTTTGRPTGAMKRLTSLRAGSDVTYLYPTADGRKISVLRMLASVSVYLADFDLDTKRVSSLRRLTTTDGWNNAPAWNADSRSVFFESNREGRMQIFRQGNSDDAAAPLATGPGEASVPVLSPDGAFLLYVTPVHAMVVGSTSSVQLMRIPAAGGPPQQVLSARLVDSPRCARAPAPLCAIAERTADGRQLVFTAFDPLEGRGRELARIDADPNADYGWDLSAGGANLAFVKRVPRSDGKIFLSDGAIHILSLQDGPSRDIKVKGVENFHQYVDWAADGKGVFIAHPTGTQSELLYVDLQGKAAVMWQPKDCDALRGIPSPDGRHVAILCGGQYNNVWLMENFR